MDIIGDLAHPAVWRDQGDHSGNERLARCELVVTAIHVGITAAIHHDLIPSAGQAAQVSVGRQRPVGLLEQQSRLRPRDDQQSTIG